MTTERPAIAGQYTLPGYDPSEADMVQDALSQPLERKVAQAIALLQLWEPKALELSQNGYWLAYSGGKDSEVILDLAKRAGVRHEAVYNVTTIDPPELVRFIKREHPEVRFSHQPRAMLTAMHDAGNEPPTRVARWCCAEYKEQGGTGLVKIIGVRIAESPRRAALWRQVVPHRVSGTFLCPIVYWTDEDVWDYHREHELKHCTLYDEGFKRLGCIGCPQGRADQIARQFRRWPRYAAWWRREVVRFWESNHARTVRGGKLHRCADWPSGEAFFEWWASGERKADADECQAGSLFI